MAPAPELRIVKGNWTKPCEKTPSLFSSYSFKFLNVKHELKSLNDWNNPRWNIERFHHGIINMWTF